MPSSALSGENASARAVAGSAPLALGVGRGPEGGRGCSPPLGVTAPAVAVAPAPPPGGVVVTAAARGGDAALPRGEGGRGGGVEIGRDCGCGGGCGGGGGAACGAGGIAPSSDAEIVISPARGAEPAPSSAGKGGIRATGAAYTDGSYVAAESGRRLVIEPVERDVGSAPCVGVARMPSSVGSGCARTPAVAAGVVAGVLDGGSGGSGGCGGDTDTAGVVARRG